MVYTDGHYECEYCGNVQFAEGDEAGVSAMKKIYADAFQMMQAAADYDGYMQAARMFREIPAYEDSMRLAQMCINAAEEAALEEDYQEALRFFSQNSESSLKKAIELFMKAADYKDSNEYLIRAGKKLEMIHARKRSGLFLSMWKAYPREFCMLIVSEFLTLLGILLPWYQARGICEFLFWEIETVTDSMGLVRVIYQAFGGFSYIWWVFFLICTVGVSVTLVRKDFRKVPLFMAGFLILLCAACSAEPPAGYGKAGFGQFFMAAGLVGFLMNWIAVYIASKRKGAQRRSDGMSRRSGDSR